MMRSLGCEWGWLQSLGPRLRSWAYSPGLEGSPNKIAVCDALPGRLFHSISSGSLKSRALRSIITASAPKAAIQFDPFCGPAGLFVLADGSERTARARIPTIRDGRQKPGLLKVDIFIRISFTRTESRIAGKVQ